MSDSEDSDSDFDASSLMYLLPEPELKISGKTLVKGLNRDTTHVRIPEGIENIREFAFMDFVFLKSVQFPNSLVNIGLDAFYKCSSLNSVDLSSTRLTCIGGNAFSYCTNISSIQLPRSLNTIEYAAFYRCAGITNIVFPIGLVNIEAVAFSECTSLTSVDLSQSSLCSFGTGAFSKCTHLTSVELPELLTSIGHWAFGNCTRLRVLVPPCSVQPDSFQACALVVNASGNTITNSVVVDPRIIGLRKQLFAMWTQSVRRQGLLRQTRRKYRMKETGASQSFVDLYSAEELLEVVEVWTEIKQILARVARRDEVVKFLFAKIIKGGNKLVRMQSYLSQPTETKVFKQVFEDLGISEPFTESGGEEKEVHIAKRMKRLQLRF